jgi:YVTN family beta-propeller protein
MTITHDEHFVYFQVSFFHGFVEYDLRKDKVTRVAKLPLTEVSKDIPRENYLLDSAHHGLALDPTGHKLCVAGTMSDYGAIVHRDDFSFKIVDDHITKPYWSTNSGDGRYCYISASGDDSVVVVSYATEKVVHRFKVGDHPQRVRNGVVRLDQYPRKSRRFGLKVRAVKGVRRAACSSTVVLVRCRVTVRAKGRVIGRGERFRRGAKTLTLRIGVTPAGRKLMRKGLRRATLTAVGTDTAGRTRRARARVKLR